jgi:hypothetical protein
MSFLQVPALRLGFRRGSTTIRADMRDAPLPDLFLYARAGCHLCDDARNALSALFSERTAAGRPTPKVVERDIETDPDWERAYHASIPVVILGDRRLDLATSPARLRRLLGDVLDA